MHDTVEWGVLARVEKFDASDLQQYRRRGKFEKTACRVDENGLFVPRSEIVKAGIKPYEVVESVGNLLTTAGVTRVWNLFGNLSATQAFDNTHARIGTGNTANAAGSEAAGDTDLAATAGSANRWFNLVDAGVGVGGPIVTTNQLKYVSTFATGNGNYAWNEWGIDNGTASGNTVTAPLLNHKIVSGGLGTKTSSASWAFTVTVTLS